MILQDHTKSKLEKQLAQHFIMKKLLNELLHSLENEDNPRMRYEIVTVIKNLLDKYLFIKRSEVL